jgi:choline dehydrogenase
VSWISQANRKSSADANTVGASLLAKNVNDNACILEKRVAFEFFASRLAPTEKPQKKAA